MRRLIIVIAALSLVAAACGGGSSEAQVAADECSLGEVDGDLNLYNWTEYIPTGSVAEEAEVTDLLAAFEEEYGVDVVLTEYDSNEVMLAQIDAGVAFDLVVPSDYMVSIMKTSDLLVKLNPDTIPNLTNIADEFTDLPYDPGNEYSVPYQWGTTGIGYQYGMIDDEEGVSWGVIFDPELAEPNAGFISLLDDERTKPRWTKPPR
jgi:spermidine/putrescine-binding protein